MKPYLRHWILTLSIAAIATPLVAAQEMRLRIGTVVPWSARTLVPQATDAALVNAALDRASPRLYPDFDDAHAPCIYVRGRVLRDVGGADALSDRASL